MKYVLMLLLFLILHHSAAAQFGMTTAWQKREIGFAMHAGAFDMNRDGFQDVVVGNYYDTHVYLYQDTSQIPSYEPDYYYEGRMLAVLDFNGDGNKDMITLNFVESDSLTWTHEGELLYYFGNDSLVPAIDTVVDYRAPTPVKFPEVDRFSYGYTKSGIRTGDINGDGKEDLVVSSFRYPMADDYGRIDLFLGKETPVDTSDYSAKLDTFNYNLGFGMYFEVGDINGDGYDDILTSNYEFYAMKIPRKERLFIYYGGPDFTMNFDSYDEKYTSWVLGDGPVSERWSHWFRHDFSMADVNQDGIDDLIISGLGYENDSTKIHFGSPEGIDTIPSLILTDLKPGDPYINAGGLAIPIGDFNYDGWNDFILKPAAYHSFALILGGPDCGSHNPFGLRGFISAGFSFPEWAFSVGDYEGDGDEELVVIQRCWTDGNFGYILLFYGNYGVQGIEDESDETMPEEFLLHQNYPNPFNGQTTVSYYLPESRDVKLKIYDLLGAEVDTLEFGRMAAGEHSVSIDFNQYGLTSGVYLIKVSAGKQTKQLKITYLK